MKGGDNEKKNIKSRRQLSLPAIPEVVRPDINIGKFADFIFLPSHSTRLRIARKKQWKEDHGKHKAIGSLLIEPLVSRTSPTTRTFLVFLAVCHLWHERRETDGSVLFSYRDIGKLLIWKWAGRRTADVVKHELGILRGTLLTWKLSFINKDGVKITPAKPFNILAEAEWVEQEERAPTARFEAIHRLRFDPIIERNMEARRVRPVLLSELLTIKGEFAQTLYVRLDLIHVQARYYERRAAKLLFDDFQVEKEGYYKYPGHRKQFLTKTVKELNGRRLTTGKILKVGLRHTNDQADWKLISEAVLSPEFLARKNRLPVVNRGEQRELLAVDMQSAVGDKEHIELYRALASHYPDSVLYRAIAEFKADGGRVATYPRRFFIAVIHRLAHTNKMEWIKACGRGCKFREENSLPFRG